MPAGYTPFAFHFISTHPLRFCISLLNRVLFQRCHNGSIPLSAAKTRVDSIFKRRQYRHFQSELSHFVDSPLCSHELIACSSTWRPYFSHLTGSNFITCNEIFPLTRLSNEFGFSVFCFNDRNRWLKKYTFAIFFVEIFYHSLSDSSQTKCHTQIRCLQFT